jgi:hypothetical protein
MAVGAFTATVPWIIVSLVLPLPIHAYSNGRVTIENGSLTLGGWISLLEQLTLTAILGSIGGLIFWATVIRSDPRYRRA